MAAEFLHAGEATSARRLLQSVASVYRRERWTPLLASSLQVPAPTARARCVVTLPLQPSGAHTCPESRGAPRDPPLQGLRECARQLAIPDDHRDLSLEFGSLPGLAEVHPPERAAVFASAVAAMEGAGATRAEGTAEGGGQQQVSSSAAAPVEAKQGSAAAGLLTCLLSVSRAGPGDSEEAGAQCAVSAVLRANTPLPLPLRSVTLQATVSRPGGATDTIEAPLIISAGEAAGDSGGAASVHGWVALKGQTPGPPAPGSESHLLVSVGRVAQSSCHRMLFAPSFVSNSRFTFSHAAPLAPCRPSFSIRIPLTHLEGSLLASPSTAPGGPAPPLPPGLTQLARSAGAGVGAGGDAWRGSAPDRALLRVVGSGRALRGAASLLWVAVDTHGQACSSTRCQCVLRGDRFVSISDTHATFVLPLLTPQASPLVGTRIRARATPQCAAVPLPSPVSPSAASAAEDFAAALNDEAGILIGEPTALSFPMQPARFGSCLSHD